MTDTKRKTAFQFLGYKVALCGVLLLTTLSSHAALFRYKDESGNLVLSTTIPADRVRYGYDMVDNYGNLMERIEPQLSDEAYAEKLARDAMIKTCEKSLNRVRKLYQFESDIDYAEEQGLTSIDQSISNIRANLTVVTSQRQEFETQAAQLDIAGQKIPNALLDNIERAKAQEQNLTDEIDKRFGEKLKLREMHAYDRAVFGLRNCDNGLPEKQP